MNRLRNRLILVFLAATLAPLAATLWITKSLIEHSLSLTPTRELDQLSKSLHSAGRALYQQARAELLEDVRSGRVDGQRYGAASRESWPGDVQDFAASTDTERFTISGRNGDTLLYLNRAGSDIVVYRRDLGIGMRNLAAQHSAARQVIDEASGRDLRKGFTYTLVLLAAATWIVALIALVYWAARISRPIHELTAGLTELANGNLKARVRARGNDEVGAAMLAFNHTAGQLEESRDRLIHVTRIASWQSLARKMAHEVKNSLTPIRLTMEEMIARRQDRDEQFIDQAAQIVVDEVTTLERRVRAFSDYSAEPPVKLTEIDVNSMLEERVALLRTAHPEVIYDLHLAGDRPRAVADADLVKGVLTNLLENAAHAAGGGGVVMGRTALKDSKVVIEVHDSGPGLSLLAKNSLFEPTISFKKSGMGLGLSIARRSAMLSGGDIALVEGELGGAAFRLMLPAVAV